MNAKTEICQLSQSRLGNISLVSDIDNPETPAEKAYAKWYDVCREDLLKTLMPNFALCRIIVPRLAEKPAFGWAFAYQYPNDCLKVLGIGETQSKENNLSVETLPSGTMAILSDDDCPSGMPIRFIRNIQDVGKFSPEFIMLLSWALAYNCCIEITKDYDKLNYIEKVMPSKLSAASSVNAQENKPVRINTSKFKQARYIDNPTGYIKR